MFWRSASAAWRSDKPSRAWRTMVEAITSAGTDGRPRPEGNRSANNSSGNRSLRWSAKKAYTEPSATRWRHRAAASNNSMRVGSFVPCMRAVSRTAHPQPGTFTSDLLSSLLALVQGAPAGGAAAHPGGGQLGPVAGADAEGA